RGARTLRVDQGTLYRNGAAPECLPDDADRRGRRGRGLRDRAGDHVACRLSPGVTGPASSLPLERIDDTLARQRPGEVLLALPRGGAVDHRAGDVARGGAGRSVAGGRLVARWRAAGPALLREHQP